MSNKKLIKLAAVAVIGAAGFLATQAQAAVVSVTASFTDIALSSFLTVSNHSYLSDASTPFESGFDTGSVLTGYSFNTSTATNSSAATVDNTFDPLPQTTAFAKGDGQGHASVLWTFDWVATQSGAASISMEFLSAAIVSNLGAGESAFARSFASVLLDGSSLEDSANYVFNGTAGNVGGFETLALFFNVVAGQHGSFTLAVSSDAYAAPAPVPVPAALPLLASALLGFGAFARRRRESAAA